MMAQIKAWTLVMCLLALGASAAGREGVSALKLRVVDETAPAGSSVQMKIRTYEVTPISSSFSRALTSATSDRFWASLLTRSGISSSRTGPRGETRAPPGMARSLSRFNLYSG